MYHLGFVKPVDRFGERIVVAVADTADGWHKTDLSKPLGALDRDILHTSVRMVDEAIVRKWFSIMKCLLQHIEYKAGVRRPADASADDPTRIGIDTEGDIEEASPSRDIREIGDPQYVGSWHLKLSVDVIKRAGSGFIQHRCAHPLATDNTLQTHGLHQTLDRAPRDIRTLALQLSPDFARAVDTEVFIENPLDLGL
jgi:hypothetical protein